MKIGSGAFTYHWHEHWARVPDSPAARWRGRTHGVEVLSDGRVAVFAQTVPAILIFHQDGSYSHGLGDRFIGAHGMTLTMHGGIEAFWLTDEESCEVVKVAVDGTTLQRIAPPPVDARPAGRFKPTWAEQNPMTGEVWVADGYGGSALHLYDAGGRYLKSFDALGAIGRLDQPHGIRFSPRGELWLTDRGHHRVLVLDGNGQVLRESVSACHSPCSFAFHGEHVFVVELFGAIKVLDHELRVLAELGASPELVPPKGWEQQKGWIWPSEMSANGWPDLAGTGRIKPGVFSSPHGIACSPSGDVYVVEWTLGGRIIKLEAVR